MAKGNGIDQANKLGDLLNSWTKIIVTLGIAVSSCAYAYWMIFENEKNIEIERENRKKEIILLEERSDKRYSRAMEIATKLENWGMKLEERIRVLERENSYMKGKLESQ